MLIGLSRDVIVPVDEIILYYDARSKNIKLFKVFARNITSVVTSVVTSVDNNQNHFT